MRGVCLALPGNDTLAAVLADACSADVGELTVRPFPDRESYVRIAGDVAGREVILACTLDRPDPKVVPLTLVAATARDLGATRVGLVAPYLAYLRQDRRFVPGEGVTSRYFARFLAASVDWLVTVDPHLHRLGSLAELYPIPVTTLHAAPVVAAWISANVRDPVLVGPDAESVQWVAAVARDAGAPHLVLDKTRHGDREVTVTARGIERWPGRTPVLLDDIISTGHTMIAAIRDLERRRTPAPVVIGVHAVFADGAYEELLAARPARLVTANTIPHPSNGIDLNNVLAHGVRAVVCADG